MFMVYNCNSFFVCLFFGQVNPTYTHTYIRTYIHTHIHTHFFVLNVFLMSCVNIELLSCLKFPLTQPLQPRLIFGLWAVPCTQLPLGRVRVMGLPLLPTVDTLSSPESSK